MNNGLTADRDSNGERILNRTDNTIRGQTTQYLPNSNGKEAAVFLLTGKEGGTTEVRHNIVGYLTSTEQVYDTM